MSRYPTIQSAPISFTVTTIGVLKPTVSDVDYTLGSKPLTILYDSFKTIPNDLNVGPAEVNAYFYTGDLELPEVLDFTCSCLT